MGQLAHAVLVPRGYVGPGRAVDQHRRAYSLFGPICGCTAFWVAQTPAGSLLVPRSSIAAIDADLEGTSLRFESGHPLAGHDRYQWYLLRREWPGGPVQLGERIDSPFDFPEEAKAGFRRTDAPDYRDSGLIRSLAEDRDRRAERLATMMRTALGDPELYTILRNKTGASDAEMEELFGHYDQRTF